MLCLWETENLELYWCEWSSQHAWQAEKCSRPTDLYSGTMWMFIISLYCSLSWSQNDSSVIVSSCAAQHTKNCHKRPSEGQKDILLWAWMLKCFCFNCSICVSSEIKTVYTSANLQFFCLYFPAHWIPSNFNLSSVFLLLPPPNTSVTTCCLVQPGSQRLISAIFWAQEIRGHPHRAAGNERGSQLLFCQPSFSLLCN